MDDVFGSAGVDSDDALGFAARNGLELIVDALEEGVIFLLEAILVHLASGGEVSSLRAGDAVGYIIVEEDGEVGLEAEAEYAMHGEHGIDAKLASGALVGLGGVGVAVAQDPLAAIHGGTDDLGDELRARGEHEGELGERSQSVSARIEENAANAFAYLGASGLAGGEDLDALFTQEIGEPLLMRAFAAAVEPLEGDESSAFFSAPHIGIITKRESAA